MYYNSVVPQYPLVLLELLFLKFRPPLTLFQVNMTDAGDTHDQGSWVQFPKLVKLTPLITFL